MHFRYVNDLDGHTVNLPMGTLKTAEIKVIGRSAIGCGSTAKYRVIINNPNKMVCFYGRATRTERRVTTRRTNHRYTIITCP